MGGGLEEERQGAREGGGKMDHELVYVESGFFHGGVGGPLFEHGENDSRAVVAETVGAGGLHALGREVLDETDDGGPAREPMRDTFGSEIDAEVRGKRS